MTSHRSSTLASVAFIAAVSLPHCGLAQPATSGSPPATNAPAEQMLAMDSILRAALDDPAFNQYVDITLLGPAWANKDADLLTDIALQLADGEKVLLRSHKAGSSRDMLKLAVSIAVRKGNKETIARIEKASKALNLEDVAAEAASAAQLAGAPRKAEPALAVSLDQVNLSEIAEYGLLVDDVHDAKLLHDKNLLDDLEKNIPKLKYLNEIQLNYLKKIIGEARSAIGDKPVNNSVAATIGKLDGASRQLRLDRPPVDPKEYHDFTRRHSGHWDFRGDYPGYRRNDPWHPHGANWHEELYKDRGGHNQ